MFYPLAHDTNRLESLDLAMRLFSTIIPQTLWIIPDNCDIVTRVISSLIP